MTSKKVIQHQGSRRKLVAVVGDAGIDPKTPQAEAARSVGRFIIDHGFRLVTGGLSGVMEAACEGARSSPAYREGDIVGILPGHSPNEANPFVDIAIATGMDHLRNSIVAHADGIIGIGGGAGTLSEISLAWIYRRLIVCLRGEGWSGKLADSCLDQRKRYPSLPNDQIFGADTPQEAVKRIAELIPFYEANFRGISQKK